MDEFISLFTDFYTLKKVFKRACNSFIPYVKDPITDIAANMIRLKFNVSLTMKGLVFFLEAPHVILYYENMTVEQKEYLSTLLSERENSNGFRVNGNAVYLFSASCMGKSKSCSFETMDVLLCVCSCLLGTRSSSTLSMTSRRMLCNLFLQRIGCVVHVPHQTLVKAYEWAHDNSTLSNPVETIYHESIAGTGDDNTEPPTVSSECANSGQDAVICGTKKRALASLAVED